MKKKFILCIGIALLIVTIVSLLAACSATPNAKQLEKKLQDKGYSVEYYNADMSHGGDENIIQVLHAWSGNGEDGNVMIVYWYNSEKAAKEAFKNEYENLDFGEGFSTMRKGKAIDISLTSLLDNV